MRILQGAVVLVGLEVEEEDVSAVFDFEVRIVHGPLDHAKQATNHIDALHSLPDLGNACDRGGGAAGAVRQPELHRQDEAVLPSPHCHCRLFSSVGWLTEGSIKGDERERKDERNSWPRPDSPLICFAELIRETD